LITIKPIYNEFKIIVSNPGSGTRGFSTIAKNLDEIHQAIDHCHGKHWDKNLENCPLCRDRNVSRQRLS
jgi:recombinational DNA repair protein RecR